MNHGEGDKKDMRGTEQDKNSSGDSTSAGKRNKTKQKKPTSCYYYNTKV